MSEKKNIRTRIYIGDTENLKNSRIFGEYYEKMPDGRKKKIDKYKFDKDKRLSLGAGILLKKALEDIGIDYEKEETAEYKNKKPYLKNHPEVHFNLSHSGNRVMCAVSANPIGCDVELIEKIDLNVAKRFFSETEYDYLSGKNTEEEKTVSFYRIWTLKESYVKALGEGLSIPLNAFDIVFENEIVCKIEGNTFKSCYFTEYRQSDREYRYSSCEIVEGEYTQPQVIEISI